VSRREPPRARTCWSPRAPSTTASAVRPQPGARSAAEAEAVARQTLTSLEESKQRMVRREERLDARLDSLTGRETSISPVRRARPSVSKGAEEHFREQAAAFEVIRLLSPAERGAPCSTGVARTARRARHQARAEVRPRRAEESSAASRARPGRLAVQPRLAMLVGEFALVPVPIPREEIKGDHRARGPQHQGVRVDDGR